MSSPSPKSFMSPRELTICEDILESHRKYAIDLLLSVKKLCGSHRADSCLETREGRICSLCELCSAGGLLGATEKTLATYDDEEKRLKTARASLGKSVFPSTATPSRETLFRNSLAQAVFLSIVTTGDSLRSQHAAWRARLAVMLSSSAQGLQQTDASPHDLDQNRNLDALLPTYSGPRVVGAESHLESTMGSTGFVPESTPSSSMIVVFKRCLSSDCPCKAHRANAASNAKLEGAGGSQVASKTDSKKTRTSKNFFERHTRKTSNASDARIKAKTNAQAQNPTVHHDLNSPGDRAPDTPSPLNVVLEENTSSRSTSKTTSWTRETDPPSPKCSASIMDPRVLRLRAQILRSDDACRALMEWCRACRTDLQLDLREGHGTGVTHEKAEGTRRYPSVLACSLEAVQPAKL